MSFLCSSLLVISLFSIEKVLSTGCGLVGNAPNSITTKQYMYEGVPREYIIHVPINYDKDTPTQIIYALPGYDTPAQNFSDDFGFQEQGNSNNYISVVVAAATFEDPAIPGYYHQTWNDLSCSNARCNKKSTVNTWVSWYGATTATPPTCSDGGIVINDTYYYNACNWCDCRVDDIGFLKALTEEIKSKYCIDITRQYIMGFSAGGMMTQRMACQANDIFAGAVSFHGQLHKTHLCEPRYGDYPMPYMNIWADNDVIVPPESGVDIAGWRYLTVDKVQKKFARFNGCKKINADGPEDIVTVSDGINDWSCTGYNDGCDDGAYTLSCGRTGDHSLPIDPNTGYNYGLAAAYEFLSQFQRIIISE